MPRSVQAADEALNNNVTSLQVQVDELRGQIQNLTTQLENVIVDVNVDNQTTGNTTAPPVVCEPPAVLNATSNQCETPIIVPPVDNGTGGGNETGNETGNVTG